MDDRETLNFLDYWRVMRSRREIIIAVFLLAVVTGFLITYIMPRVYMASVIVQVKEESLDVPVFEREMNRSDPLFLRTQFEIIQSRPVLEEVVRKARLDEKLGVAYDYMHLPNRQEMTYKLLKKSMKVQQFRDTNLIEIQIYLSEPKDSVLEEVAATANLIAEVYRDQQIDSSRESTERALKALYESIEEQQKRVAAAEATLAEVRKKYQIDVLSDKTDTTVGRLGLSRLEDYRILARMELAEKEARYKIIINLSEESLLDAASYVVGDPALGKLVAEKREAEVEISRLRAAYGPKHPDVVRVEAMIGELGRKIADALKGLKVGVEADYEAAKAKFDILEAEKHSLTASEIDDETGGYREYVKALEGLEHAKKIAEVMEMRWLQERIELRIPKTTVQVKERARPPDQKDWVSPNLLLNMILSILAGLGAGMGLAFFIEHIDTSVKTIEEVERNMHVRVLGVIPEKVNPFHRGVVQGKHSEAYRVLRTNIKFSSRIQEGKTFCITSGSVGEGKSLTLFNLAYVCAELGDSVLVVDTDLHRPTQHAILNVSNELGLANVLVGEAQLEDVIVATGLSNLDFLPSGKLSTAVHGLLDTRKVKEIMNRVRDAYDLIFFDAPPILGVSDASLLVREVDGVLLVIQHRKYPRAISKRAKEILESVGANLVGVVLNNINMARDYSDYYYHYYTYPELPSSGKKG